MTYELKAQELTAEQRRPQYETGPETLERYSVISGGVEIGAVDLSIWPSHRCWHAVLHVATQTGVNAGLAQGYAQEPEEAVIDAIRKGQAEAAAYSAGMRRLRSLICGGEGEA